EDAGAVGAREVDVDPAPRSGVLERAVGREREVVGVLPDVANEVGPLAAQEEDAVAAAPAAGDPRHVAHEPHAADDRRRGDRPAARLVVERDVARYDRDSELAGPARDALDPLRELPA